MKVDITITVRDQKGKVVKVIKKRAHSYVRGMIDLLRQHMSQSATSFMATDGVERNTAPSWAGTFTANAGAGSSAYGVQVGTSTTVVLITNYKLWTQIAHGSGAGQLDYGACSVGVPSTVGTARRFTVARTFTNNSGASITVEEVGLVVWAQDESANTRYVLIDRTLLEVTIPNANFVTMTYTIKVTV